MIYIIILIILFVISIPFILKIKVNIKYKIIEYNKIKLQIKFFLFNKTIFKFSSNNSLTEIATTYFNKNIDKNRKMKLKDSLKDSKKYINHAIKNISKEKIHINIFVSSSNAILTIYLSTFISTIISIFLAKNINNKYINNVKYIVTPKYTNDYILLNINIDTKLIKILILFIKIFFQITRRKFNGKSSNRKLNVNSND